MPVRCYIPRLLARGVAKKLETCSAPLKTRIMTTRRTLPILNLTSGMRTRPIVFAGDY